MRVSTTAAWTGRRRKAMSGEFQPSVSQKLLTNKQYLSHLHVGDGGVKDGGHGWKAADDILHGRPLCF